MALDLFRHNGYESAVKMLQERGKTAVIHPAGTGKSFIGFQLCLKLFGRLNDTLTPDRQTRLTETDMIWVKE